MKVLLCSCFRLNAVIGNSSFWIIRKPLIMVRWKNSVLGMTTSRKKDKSFRGIRLSSPLTAVKPTASYRMGKKSAAW